MSELRGNPKPETLLTEGAATVFTNDMTTTAATEARNALATAMAVWNLIEWMAGQR